MQDKTGIRLHRAAGHHLVSRANGGRQFDTQILHHVFVTDIHRAVQGQAHGTVFVVLENVRQAVLEIGIIKLRHGDQELVFQGIAVHACKYRPCDRLRARHGKALWQRAVL